MHAFMHVSITVYIMSCLSTVKERDGSHAHGRPKNKKQRNEILISDTHAYIIYVNSINKR
jgi:hypothetical protein